MTTRCVNLDWLEVFAFETGAPHDADFFRRAGFVVDERDYGTRIYNQMFTLMGTDGHPLVEVRRSPKSLLLPQQASHLRLVNRACYLEHAADIMTQFMNDYGYIFQRVARVDICYDLVRFDDNTQPRVFMQRFMRGKFAKINQANISAHGSDHWTGRVWNSVKWGSPSSMISTKFYNKTLELYDPRTDSYGKPYIRAAWFDAGIIDNIDRCTLNGEPVEVWRVEFSITSSVKRWVVLELNGKSRAYQSIHNTLDCYNSREKLLTMFAALQEHYFHFKRYIPGQRKDRCPDRRLFNFKGVQLMVKPEHADTLAVNTPDPTLLRLIRQLRSFLVTTDSLDARNQAQRLLTLLETIQLRQEQSNPASFAELTTWQTLLRRRMNGEHNATYNAIMQEVAAVLSLSDKVLPFLGRTNRKKAVQ